MPDVLIRHLRLRVIRTGSLFWGTDPRALARRALAALPELLAEELGRLGVGDGAALELPAPVRLRLRATSAGLAGVLAGAERSCVLRSAVRVALEEALASVASHTSVAALDGLERAGAAPPHRSAIGSLLPLYLAGELPARLREMGKGLLQAYHRLLLLEPAPSFDPPRPATAVELEECDRVVGALVVGFAYSREQGDSEERVRERIIAAIAIAAQIGVAPSERGVRSLIDRLLPTANAAVPPGLLARRAEYPLDAGVRVHAPETPFQPSLTTKSPPRTKAELAADRTAPILPLLAAASLARSRALAQVAHHLDRMGRGEGLPLWIAGLAFKLGPAPERGWIYKDENWRAVAAIADHPLHSGQELVRLADDPGANWEELTSALLGKENDELDPILVARPACALARKPQFDRHMSWVAGWVLTQIALALWPKAHTPIAAAFQRLMSLEVSIRRTEHGLAVRVPLGKRRNDLLRAGLLEDVHEAPWLHGGGSVRFLGG